VISIICLALIVSVCSNQNKLSNCDDNKIKVLSFNIRYGTAKDGDNSWKYRKDLVFDLLKDQDAHVVGLQEALHFQIEEIVQTLPVYEYIGVGRDDGDTLGEYSAILYKTDNFKVLDSGTFWLSDHPEQVASIDWGNACTRICTWAHFQTKDTSQKFFVYNLHLDHVSQISREKSIELLKQKIKNQTSSFPVIITGDFNAGESNPAIINLRRTFQKTSDQTELKIYDSFRKMFPDAENVGTFNSFKGDTTGEKIDYIFIDQNIKVLDAAILKTNKNGQYPSDHFPIMAKLCF